ncbi:MAG: hypothetical protein ACKV22_33125 [Bryobacteraceae bacterium]
MTFIAGLDLGRQRDPSALAIVSGWNPVPATSPARISACAPCTCFPVGTPYQAVVACGEDTLRAKAKTRFGRQATAR